MESRTSDPKLEALLLRLLLGSLFIAHLYWKIAVPPGGIGTWWSSLQNAGYPWFVPAYASAEIAGALLLIPACSTRYVALYAIPMMTGAAQFWMVRKGFGFTAAGLRTSSGLGRAARHPGGGRRCCRMRATRTGLPS